MAAILPTPCCRAPPAPCVGCAAASERPALRRNTRADGHGHLPLCSPVRGNRSRLVRCAITVPFAPLAQRASSSEEHTSEHQSLMRISYDVLCLKTNRNQIKDKIV